MIYTHISQIAWGYLWIYLNIHLGSINILPAFVGYFLLWQAIDALKDKEQEMQLLRPLVFILIGWHGMQWILSWKGFNLGEWSTFLSLIIFMIDLYFHFQFLTNLASIAARYADGDYNEKLLRYRTIITILNTIIAVITYIRNWMGAYADVVAAILLIINVIYLISLMSTLFKLRKDIEMRCSL